MVTNDGRFNLGAQRDRQFNLVAQRSAPSGRGFVYQPGLGKCRAYVFHTHFDSNRYAVFTLFHLRSIMETRSM